MTARVIPFPRAQQDQEGSWPMAHKATDWAWEAPVRGVRQHVLLALAERADRHTYECHPSLPELARRTGIGESTIRGHLRALEDAGLIKVDQSNGGRRQRSTYRLPVGSQFETPQELAGKGPRKPRQTRQQPAGSEGTDTPQEVSGSGTETPQELATNPPGAGPVVLRTNTGTREPGTTGAADAPLLTDDDALFGVVDPSPSRQLVVVRTARPARRRTEIEERGYPSCAPAADAWYAGYVETHDAKPTDQRMGQVRRECAALLKAGNELDKVVFAARAAGMKGRATVNAEFDHLAANPAARAAVLAARPSTTDQRVAAGQALIAKYSQETA